MIPLHDDNPTEIRPWVTIGIIATCIVVFLWQIFQPTEEFNLIAYRLGFIDHQQLESQAKLFANSSYGAHLQRIADEA